MSATVALTKEQYADIIETMQTGATGIRPNPRIAAALQLEANLGMRISDILQLRLSDIIKDGGRYRLNIVEQKTGKHRTFTVPAEVYSFLRDYADAQGIGKEEPLFPLTVRAVQKHLAKVCELLELENISTHSFRKFFALDIYENNGSDIALVQELLQHSSPAITRRYITVSAERVEQAIAKHTMLI
jgi:integrase